MRRQKIISTLTQQRLSKYLTASHGVEQHALKLYVLNAKVSAAFLTDIHYVEIALRNKFDAELANGFCSPHWFSVPSFTTLLDKRGHDILYSAQRAAMKKYPKGTVITAIPTGKMIAELTFGFWLSLTDRKFTHSLWTPYLYKAFSPNPAPNRAVFNLSLEKVRQLRNRIAHHEPIFHMNLLEAHRNLCDVTHALCPTIAIVMKHTSTVKREIMMMSRYRSYQGF